ncbi:MAG TPA: TonB-dependent receptor, partial [Gemmatimonadales bacterium]|nr:TonB-dependent receptor [Gemmatimonadales bacterium]
AAWPARLAAQDTSPAGRIAGMVRNTSNERAGGIGLALEGTGRTTITDSLGRFRFDSLMAGEYRLEVTGPEGTVVLRTPVTVRSGETATVSITIPSPVELPPITTAVARPARPASTLPDVQGAFLYSAKKTEVVNLDSLTANSAQNVTRQLVARVPGANLSEAAYGGFPSNGIGVRGLTPTQSVEMNVRQDGVNIVADLYGYPETYYTPPAQAIEQIEFVRGSSSLQFGPQFGGVVNYDLRDGAPDTRPTFTLRQTAGSYAALTSYGSVAGGSSRLTYFGYGQYVHRDGFRPNSGVEEVSAAGRIGYDLSSRVRLSAEYTLYRNRLQMPGGLSDAEFAANWAQSFRSRNWLASPWNVLALKAEANLGRSTVLTNSVSYMFSQRYLVWRNEDGGPESPDSIDPGTGAFTPREVEREYFNNITDELRLRTSFTLLGLPQTVATGVRAFAGTLHRQEGGPGTTGSDFDMALIGGGYATDVSFFNSNVAAYAENIIRVSERLSLSPGVRVERLHSTASGHTDTTFAPLARDRVFVLAGAGLQFQTTSSTQLYANITQAYRPIEYSFLVPFGGGVRVDPHLRDPRGYNADLSWRGRLGAAVSFDLGIFYLSYHDRIGLISGSDSTGPYLLRTNVATSVHKGVESYLQVQPLVLAGVPQGRGTFSIFDALGYTHARYTTGEFAGKRVEFAPEVVHRMGATYERGAFATTFQISTTSKQFSDANNTVSSPDAEVGIIPAYTLLDWSGRYRLGRWTFEGGVNNLADRHYFTMRTSEYPGPGIIPGTARSVYITLGTSF